ncbi:TIR domain-containing protein [Rheinheimera sp. EpRS3]|uniref:TIR domain-containing protein n=1 Tax=Rheinheimera sp. EpRS3 TaxID=1712383 RepID=UPI0007483350|nr:nucleotide-binding protein [Rheinheimera sp. EpRS3]KUM55160.1 hypothetical protein AR688_18140 [Rheinheimera sp. EpRS3]
MNETGQHIDELITEGKRLEPHGNSTFEGYNSDMQSEYLAWRLQSLEALRECGPSTNQALREIEQDNHSPYFYNKSVSQLLGALSAAKALLLRQESRKATRVLKSDGQETSSNKVFVVHGHDETLLNQVARYLEKLQIEPVILFEQPGKGQTIIEKLESNSNVSFAIVLFTPDDTGGKAADGSVAHKPRARQNVVLELGYFLGRLSRSKVAVLYDPSVELPSDYHGVEYLRIDAEGAWKLKLAAELKAGGIELDMNRAI